MALNAIKKPGRKDFTIKRGDSFRRVLQLRQGGVPIDLTGYDAESTIRRREGDQKIVGFTASVLMPETDGKIEIKLTVPQTRDLPGTCFYDLQVILTSDPDNNTHTVVEGEITVPDEFTI